MGKHATHDIHANTRAAFDRLKLGERAALVLHTYLLASVPLTDRETAERLGFADLNGVRPSVSSLIDRGLLYEVQQVVCGVTRKRVRVCAPTSIARPTPTQMDIREVLGEPVR